MTYAEIISKVSKDTGLPEKVVNNTYKAYWLYIRNTISALPLKEDINESEYSILRTNFNIPSLGKLTCNYQRYLGVKKRFNYISKLREKNYEKNKDD